MGAPSSLRSSLLPKLTETLTLIPSPFRRTITSLSHPSPLNRMIPLKSHLSANPPSSFSQLRHITWKSPFVDTFLMKAKKNNGEGLKPKSGEGLKKIYSRRSTILPEFVNHTVQIHNGKSFTKCKITEGKVGHKFGEFALTRKRRSKEMMQAKGGKGAKGAATKGKGKGKGKK